MRREDSAIGAGKEIRQRALFVKVDVREEIQGTLQMAEGSCRAKVGFRCVRITVRGRVVGEC